jgi:hypothetical protein
MGIRSSGDRLQVLASRRDELAEQVVGFEVLEPGLRVFNRPRGRVEGPASAPSVRRADLGGGVPAPEGLDDGTTFGTIGTEAGCNG